MKFTYGVWALLFIVSLMTAGFFPALIITGLAVISGVSTGLHVQSVEGGSGWAKELGR